MPERDLLQIMPPGAVAPGGQIIISSGVDKPLNDPTMNVLTNGTHAIYLVGAIRHEDAFGRKRDGFSSVLHEGNGRRSLDGKLPRRHRIT
jgi:hypothetical protein